MRKKALAQEVEHLRNEVADLTDLVGRAVKVLEQNLSWKEWEDEILEMEEEEEL
jgi:hypothetical protein